MPRSLSEVESKLVMKLEWQRENIVTTKDIMRILKCSENYAWQIAHKLQQKKWLERIKAGTYIFIPAERGNSAIPPMNPLLAGSVLVNPYYFSYSTANLHYGFTTQVRPVVYIVTTKTKPNKRWKNNLFKLVNVSKTKFFGFTEKQIENFSVNMAEPEKALVDSIDRPSYAGGIEEVISVVFNGIKRGDSKKLVQYAIGMHSHSLIQRLGCIIDFLKQRELVDFPEAQRRILLKHVGRTVIYLAPTSIFGKSGKLNKEWLLIENISREQMLSEITIR